MNIYIYYIYIHTHRQAKCKNVTTPMDKNGNNRERKTGCCGHLIAIITIYRLVSFNYD